MRMRGGTLQLTVCARQNLEVTRACWRVPPEQSQAPV